MAGYQTEFVKRKIVQYIREEKLQDGDRLPPQRILCSTFNVGAATVSSAIKELAAEKIVRIRDKVGVLICEPDADGHTGRSIGITPGLIDCSPYNCCLSHQLQLALLRSGCRPVVFYSRDLPEVDGFELETFPGLRRSIAQHDIDAIIDMTCLSDTAVEFAAGCDIEVFQVGLNPLLNRNRVNVSLEAYLKDALPRLAAQGCRNIIVVRPDAPQAWFHCHDQPAEVRSVFVDGVFSSDDVEPFVARLLELSPAERPDGLVFFDDMIALDFVGSLLCRQRRAAADYYLPWIASLMSKQIPVKIASPKVLAGVIDLEILARHVVAAMLAKIQGKSFVAVSESVPLEWREPHYMHIV